MVAIIGHLCTPGPGSYAVTQNPTCRQVEVVEEAKFTSETRGELKPFAQVAIQIQSTDY